MPYSIRVGYGLAVPSKDAYEVSCGSWVHLIGPEGLLPPSVGIPLLLTPYETLNTFAGASSYLKLELRPWTGAPTFVPDLGCSRAAVEPLLELAFDPSRLRGGLELDALSLFAWKTPPALTPFVHFRARLLRMVGRRSGG